MCAQVVLAFGRFEVRIAGWVQHEMHQHGIEDREVLEEGSERSRDVGAGLPSFKSVPDSSTSGSTASITCSAEAVGEKGCGAMPASSGARSLCTSQCRHGIDKRVANLLGDVGRKPERGA